MSSVFRSGTFLDSDGTRHAVPQRGILGPGFHSPALQRLRVHDNLRAQKFRDM